MHSVFFGSDAVFFILGVFMLAAALYKSGLSTRMALHLLKSGATSPRRLVFQVMLTSALLSFIMSEHAVAAMMFPLVVIISKRLSSSPEGRSYSRVLFLAMAWGCVIGGIATMLGGARVPLAVGLLQKATQGSATVTFTQWSMGMFPIVVVLFSFCYFLLTRYYPIKILTVIEADSLSTNNFATVEGRCSRRGSSAFCWFARLPGGFSGGRRPQSWLPLPFFLSCCCLSFAW
jgi:sodium-dependent dicarboxylate transporter 2/3/5